MTDCPAEFESSQDCCHQWAIGLCIPFLLLASHGSPARRAAVFSIGSLSFLSFDFDEVDLHPGTLAQDLQTEHYSRILHSWVLSIPRILGHPHWIRIQSISRKCHHILEKGRTGQETWKSSRRIQFWAVLFKDTPSVFFCRVATIGTFYVHPGPRLSWT